MITCQHIKTVCVLHTCQYRWISQLMCSYLQPAWTQDFPLFFSLPLHVKLAGLSWPNALWSHHSRAHWVARQRCLFNQQPGNPTEDADFMVCVYMHMQNPCRWEDLTPHWEFACQVWTQFLFWFISECRAGSVHVCMWCVYLYLSSRCSFCIPGRNPNVEAPESI